ncbi:uncharacterized protein METZ01_LOCUS210406 [marine metagenome]|uniref:Uncharacterized protein n=1 Tax=marine metagenome TaxID=408172 RepID=A0A382F4J8_9ZZZZ
MEYNRVFSKALNNGALLREKLQDHMRQQNLWDDKKEKRYNDIIAKLNKAEISLKKGGIKLAEARKIAIEMRNTRLELQGLIAEKNAMDTNTAQGQAEQARFNKLLVTCLVYSNDENAPFYDDVSDYLKKQSGGSDGVGFIAAEKFGNMYFGLDSDYEQGLPENVFMKKWQFIDEDLHLVNKEGHAVDQDGRLINDIGRFIDSDGNYVDKYGNPLDEEGDYAFESQPFLDDDGNALSDPDKIEEVASDEVEESPSDKEKKTKKRGRPSKKKVDSKEEQPQTV